MQISEVQKHYLKMAIERLENKKIKQEELSKKVNQLKEDNDALQNSIKEKAYLQSSLAYLQEKCNGLKEQEENIKSEFSKANSEYTKILDELERTRAELKSLKSLENIEERGNIFLDIFVTIYSHTLMRNIGVYKKPAELKLFQSEIVLSCTWL